MTHKPQALAEGVDDGGIALFTEAAGGIRRELATATARREGALEAITDGDEHSDSDEPQIALGKLSERLSSRLGDAADDVRAINLLLREWFWTFRLLRDGDWLAAVPFMAAEAAQAINLKTWPYGFDFQATPECLKAAMDEFMDRPHDEGTLDPDTILAHGGKLGAVTGPPPLESDEPGAPIRLYENPRTLRRASSR